MSKKIITSVKAGLIATIVMTALMFMAPLMGMPKMEIGRMLAGFLGIPVFAGWIMHFMIGVILAGSYVYLFQSKLPGEKWINGALFGLIPFLMAQSFVMPMMGAGFFSSNAEAAPLLVTGSLMGHLVYGISLGLAANIRKQSNN